MSVGDLKLTFFAIQARLIQGEGAYVCMRVYACVCGRGGRKGDIDFSKYN